MIISRCPSNWSLILKLDLSIPSYQSGSYQWGYEGEGQLYFPHSHTRGANDNSDVHTLIPEWELPILLSISHTRGGGPILLSILSYKRGRWHLWCLCPHNRGGGANSTVYILIPEKDVPILMSIPNIRVKGANFAVHRLDIFMVYWIYSRSNFTKKSKIPFQLNYFIPNWKSTPIIMEIWRTYE